MIHKGMKIIPQVIPVDLIIIPHQVKITHFHFIAASTIKVWKPLPWYDSWKYNIYTKRYGYYTSVFAVWYNNSGIYIINTTTFRTLFRHTCRPCCGQSNIHWMPRNIEKSDRRWWIGLSLWKRVRKSSFLWWNNWSWSHWFHQQCCCEQSNVQWVPRNIGKSDRKWWLKIRNNCSWSEFHQHCYLTVVVFLIFFLVFLIFINFYKQVTH